MEEVYTVQEVAQSIKVSERAVRKWIESRELPAFPNGERGYRISKADLEAYIEQRKRRNLDIKDDRDNLLSSLNPVFLWARFGVHIRFEVNIIYC